MKREVALKVLPDAFIPDSDRLARFKREAQVLASLNHPNIAAICGFEASGHVQTLVLELHPWNVFLQFPVQLLEQVGFSLLMGPPRLPR